MSRSTTREHHLLSSAWYGFITILFSHIPIIIVYLIQWAKDSQIPGFNMIFDSGRLLAIWIPIIVMLLLTFYEVKEFKLFPLLENLSLILVLLLAFVLTSLYLSFYYLWIPYDRWVKWFSIGVLFIVFVLLSFSNYLEKRSVDLQESRAEDQDLLNKKYNNILKK